MSDFLLLWLYIVGTGSVPVRSFLTANKIEVQTRLSLWESCQRSRMRGHLGAVKSTSLLYSQKSAKLIRHFLFVLKIKRRQKKSKLRTLSRDPIHRLRTTTWFVTITWYSAHTPTNSLSLKQCRLVRLALQAVPSSYQSVCSVVLRLGAGCRSRFAEVGCVTFCVNFSLTADKDNPCGCPLSPVALMLYAISRILLTKGSCQVKILVIYKCYNTYKLSVKNNFAVN